MKQEEMKRGQLVILTIPEEVCLNDPVLRFDKGLGRLHRILDIIYVNKFGEVARIDFGNDTRLCLAEWLIESITDRFKE